jgi:hypothetical protein
MAQFAPTPLPSPGFPTETYDTHWNRQVNASSYYFPFTFANFPPETDGLVIHCADCKEQNPCQAGGSGAWAVGNAGVWNCSVGSNAGQTGPTGPTGPAGTPICEEFVAPNQYVIIPSSNVSPVRDCFQSVLQANSTYTDTLSDAPVAGWVFQAVFTQPSGGHNYTLALSNSAPIPFVYTTGCPSLPTMPTTTNYSLAIDMLLNANPATGIELDIESCTVTTGP